MSAVLRRHRFWDFVALLVVCGAPPTVLPLRADSATELAQIEALLEARQRRIETLREQVAAGEAQDADAARVAAMRQQIRQILSEPEFRESLMPSALQAGYDKGFFLRSSDEKFLMKINGRVQFRWTYYDTQTRNHYTQPRRDRDDYAGFDAKRIRMTLSGHAYTPNLTYLVKVLADSPTTYDPRLWYAWVNYRFIDEFQFKAGMMQLAGTRAAFHSSSTMQFPEYPTPDGVFSLGIGLGARLWGQAFGKRLEYFLDVANALGSQYNRVITPDPAELDNNPAIAFRAVWHALGENPTGDFVDWADLQFHESPALDFGFHYAFNEDNGDAQTSRIVFGRRSPLPGGFGLTTSNGLQINQFGCDAAFKWQGFSLSGEYVVQVLDARRTSGPPFTPLYLLTGDASTVANQGAYVQTGWFLPIPGLEKKLEAVARVGGVATNAGETEGTWFYAGGVNYYFQGNRVKLQADVEKITEVPISQNSWLGNVNDDALIFRVQLQVAF